MLISLDHEADKMREINTFLHVHSISLEDGFKYLSFFLKLNGYENNYWSWLIQNLEKRLFMWSHKWLSLGGRFILLKYVLQSIYIYWMHFFKLPNDIINNINSIISQFMWVGYFLKKNTSCKGGEVIKVGGCRVGILNI